MATAIEVKGLTKSFKTFKKEAGLLNSFKSLFNREYKTVYALRNVSFKVEEGEILGVIGPNGAGKSTAIKAMVGVLFPDKGNITCLGYNPWKDRVAYVKNIGAVLGPHKNQLFWDLPPVDTFYFMKELYDIDPKVFGKRMARFIKIMQLKDIVKTPVRNLSLGERMKSAVVSTLLHEPKLVFLDEPTVGVDLISKDNMHKFIKEANEKFGTTFIITTHDMADIEKLTKRIIIINKGKIVYDGPTSKIKNQIKKKILDVKLSDRIKLMKVPGTRIEKVNDSEFRVNVNTRTKKIVDVAEYILKNYNVRDITILNPPIEEVIKEIYKK